MKICAVLIFFVFITGIDGAQVQESIVVVKDERGNPDYNPDTLTVNKKEGDIQIDRVFIRDAYTKEIVNVYEISFFKTHEGKLKFFDISLVESTNFDRASYSWKNDSTVSMMLFGTQSNQFKILSFRKEGDHMDLVAN